MRVASFLAAQEPNLSSEVAVHTHLGTVMLEGFLPNGIDRKRILDAIASLEGVQEVDDHLGGTAVSRKRPRGDRAAAGSDDR